MTGMLPLPVLTGSRKQSSRCEGWGEGHFSRVRVWRVPLTRRALSDAKGIALGAATSPRRRGEVKSALYPGIRTGRLSMPRTKLE
jgi:hypothetical protein